MFRMRKSYSIILLIGAVLLAGGCGGRLVQRQELLGAARIALVSTVMPRIADTSREGNRKVLQSAVDHAAARVRTGLAGAGHWEVLDGAAIDHGKAVQSFGRGSSLDLSALFPKPDEQKRVRAAVTAREAFWREQLIGAAGLPVMPRDAFAPEGEQLPTDLALRAALIDQAGRLCGALRVDAVVFVQVRCAVTHPREKAFIVTDERTDGMLTLSATIVVVDKTGRIIADMGVRPIGPDSPSRDLLPLYRGAGRDAVTPENIDLADPKKKIAQAFPVLIDAAVADLMASLKTELTK